MNNTFNDNEILEIIHTVACCRSRIFPPGEKQEIIRMFCNKEITPDVLVEKSTSWPISDIIFGYFWILSVKDASLLKIIPHTFNMKVFNALKEFNRQKEKTYK